MLSDDDDDDDDDDDNDDDDDGFLRCKKERKKDFCNLPKVYKN